MMRWMQSRKHRLPIMGCWSRQKPLTGRLPCRRLIRIGAAAIIPAEQAEMPEGEKRTENFIPEVPGQLRKQRAWKVKPLRMITALGCGVFFISIVMIIYNLIRWACGATVAGWTSLSCSVWFLGGLILLCLGVVGEYVGKLYLESKDRPRYIIREVLEDTDEKAD